MDNEQTLCGMWLNRVRSHSLQAAFLEKKDGRYQTCSYHDFYESVKAIALGLNVSGLKRGDKVAILSENRKEWAFADMACLCLGIQDVPVYPTLPPGETAEIVHHSDSRWIFVSTFQQFEKLILCRDQIPHVEKVVIFDGIGHHNEPWLMDLNELMDTGRQEPDSVLEDEISQTAPEDVASIIYTSGTSGFPKGVMLSHRNILLNCESIEKAVRLEPSDRILSFLPLSHIFERTVGYYLMIRKAIPIAYAESMEKLVENMGEVQPTVMLSVPRFYEKMYGKMQESVRAGSIVKKGIFNFAIKSGFKNTALKKAGKEGSALFKKRLGLADKLVFSKLKARLGGKIRFFVSGGAPLEENISNFFLAAGITILEGYGISEASPVVAANRLELNKIGTVGKPLDGVDVKIAEDGEILVRGGNIMGGYYKMQQLSDETVVDGWLHTGDIGFLDEDGYLTITDRKKDIIVNSGGKNIAPQKIENLLKLDRYIADAIVIGDKQKFLTALIVPDFTNLENYAKSRQIQFKDRQALTSNSEIKKFVLERIKHRSRKLASFETVRNILMLASEFSIESGEVTPSMKLKRKKILKKYGSEISDLYKSQ